MPPTIITDELVPWSNIRKNFKDKPDLGLLLGNGASQALWEKFAYRSLYTIACDPQRMHPLTPTDQAFFQDRKTTGVVLTRHGRRGKMAVRGSAAMDSEEQECRG